MSWPTTVDGQLRALKRVFAHLDDRVDEIEQDLDCDKEGGLVAAIGDLRREVSELRAVIAEWVPLAAEDESRRQA